MYIVVTGAAGFIGSNLVKALNARGERQIIAVDNLQHADKFANLADCEIADYFDQEEFLLRLEDGDFDDDLSAVLHEGACSDTMETDGQYMLRNNYRYSVTLLEYCQEQDIPLLYASSGAVYGAGKTFREERAFELPLNVYGYSKLLFDQYVRRVWPERTAPIVGFRYFNVYGPREQHKGRMASVAWHFFNQYRATGTVKLFTGSDGYEPGEQRRDFIYVDDVVNANLYFLDHPERSGIFNVGTGTAATFNEVAVATINACQATESEAFYAPRPARSLAELRESGAIEYVPFPEGLEAKYQSFTEADISRLREAGFRQPLRPVADGVQAYVNALLGVSSVNR